MWLIRIIFTTAFAVASCYGRTIKATEENDNDNAKLIELLTAGNLWNGDGMSFADKRMGEMMSGSEVSQTQQKQQQQQQTLQGMDKDFLPFLQALSTSSNQPTNQAYSQQQSVKQDRQGYYGSSGHGGHESYSGGGLNKQIKIGVPSVGIKIDPLAIFRLLFSLIPRPLLNLNGKLFFGVELGKNAGIGVGKGVAAHPGGYYNESPGKVISIG